MVISYQANTEVILKGVQGMQEVQGVQEVRGVQEVQQEEEHMFSAITVIDFLAEREVGTLLLQAGAAMFMLRKR